MEVPAAPLPLSLYRHGFVAGLGCTLIAGLALGLFDAAMGGGVGLVPTVLGLCAAPVLGLGLYADAIAAGVNGALGPRPIARLRDDSALDTALAAALLASAILLVALSVVLGVPLQILVVKAVRKEAGAALYPVIAVIPVVSLALLAIPAQRALRRAAAMIPVLGGLPRTCSVAIAIGAAGLWWVRHRLYSAGFETQALPIAALIELAVLPVVALAIAALAYGRLASVRARIPGRGLWVAAGAAAAVGLAALTVGRQPSSEVAAAISERGGLSRLMVVVGQTLIDRDRDGYSAFFRGPDCDDQRNDISPGAKEIPGNGIDENCQYGDAAVVAATAPASGASGGGAAPTPTPAVPKHNLLIIMVDTLRVDRLGANGYRRDGESISPNLDTFLSEAVWFRKAYAQANNTPRSIIGARLA
jgi:hypothetical protein